MQSQSDLVAKFRDPVWGADKLASMALFKKFRPDELKELYQKGRFVTLQPQSHAVIEGESSRGLYLILEGTVSVYKNDTEKNSMSRIAVLEAGASFGELSLFDQAPRSASVSADTTSHCFVLDAEVFHDFLRQAGENLQLRFYRTCAEELVDRFRKLNSDYIASQNMLWRYAFRTS